MIKLIVMEWGCPCFLGLTPYLSRLVTKPTKWHVSPAKTQISLGIRPAWSESSLSAWRKTGSLATHWAHSEDSDQIGRMPRLIWVFAGRTCHFVGFVMMRLNFMWWFLQCGTVEILSDFQVWSNNKMRLSYVCGIPRTCTAPVICSPGPYGAGE